MRDDTSKLNIPRSAKRYLQDRGLKAVSSPHKFNLYMQASADLFNGGQRRGFKNKDAGVVMAKRVVETMISSPDKSRLAIIAFCAAAKDSGVRLDRGDIDRGTAAIELRSAAKAFLAATGSGQEIEVVSAESVLDIIPLIGRIWREWDIGSVDTEETVGELTSAAQAILNS